MKKLSSTLTKRASFGIPRPKRSDSWEYDWKWKKVQRQEISPPAKQKFHPLLTQAIWPISLLRLPQLSLSRFFYFFCWLALEDTAIQCVLSFLSVHWWRWRWRRRCTTSFLAVMSWSAKVWPERNKTRRKWKWEGTTTTHCCFLVRWCWWWLSHWDNQSWKLASVWGFNAAHCLSSVCVRSHSFIVVIVVIVELESIIFLFMMMMTVTYSASLALLLLRDRKKERVRLKKSTLRNLTAK